MDPFADILAFAGPATYVVSVAVLVLEYIVLRALRHRVDHRSGKVSIFSGILAFGGIAVAQRLLFLAVMQLAWTHRLGDHGAGVLAWVGAFLVYDFMFYVAHRVGHQVRVLWCFHSVHHTTEEMRLTTAIRGSAFDFAYLPWFFVWLPLLGFHPSLILIVEAAGRLWGVMVHVSPRLVGRLGPLDRWVVTPSVHRVHHGKELAYLDRNYGEVLTLWDHLAGTYEPETVAPTYGVLAPVDSRSLGAVQLEPWRDLWRDLRRAPTWGARLRYLFDAPGYSHDGPDHRVATLRAVEE